MAGYIGLVNPGSCQVKAGGQLAGRLFESCAATGLKSLTGGALEHDVLHAALAAQFAFVLAVTVLVHHQAVGLHHVERGQKIQVAAALINAGLLDVADGAHHEQAFLLAIHRLVTFQGLDGLVTADAHIQVAMLGRLPEEFHVARVQQVIAPRHKNLSFFLSHFFSSLSF